MKYTIECVEIFVTVKEDGYFQGASFSKGGFTIGNIPEPTPQAVMNKLNSVLDCGTDTDYLFIDEENPEYFQVSVIEDEDAYPDPSGNYLADYICRLVKTEYITMEAV